MRFSLLSTVLAAVFMTGSPANALESYPAETAEQFMNWCVRSQSQPPTVCSCAIDKAVLEVPASAMASFLAAGEGGGMSTTMTGVGATAVSIVATCATTTSGGSGSTGGSMLKSLGTSLGQ